jgi:CPA1 family monovalent cation:H+ antiporter
MRGALSMVLALGLALDFPHRASLITMTYGVVLVSLLAQGLTMPWLLRWFGLESVENARLSYDIARGHVSVAAAGIAEIERMAASQTSAPRILEGLRERLIRRRGEWHERLEALHHDGSDLAREEAEHAVRHLLLTEKAQITERLHQGLLRRDAYDQLLAGVNERLDRLDDGKYDDVLDLVAARETPDRTPSGELRAHPESPASNAVSR